MAGVMDEPQIPEDVRAPLLLRHHMVDVERLAILKRLVTDGTEPLLPPGEWLVALRHGVESGSPLPPIDRQGRVIGGIGLWDQPMTDHPCPGDLSQGGMALFILKDPACLPGSTGPAPILLSAPPARFGRMAPLHVALSALVHEVVQVGEDFGRHTDAEVLTPASDQRIEGVDQGHRGRAHVLSPEGFELPSYRLNRVLARLDQPLVATARAVGRGIMPNVQPSEIDAFDEVANVGFCFRPSHASCPQPGGQAMLGFDGCLLRRTQDRQIISIPDQRRGPSEHTFGTIRDSQGLLHAMEGDVQQQRTDHPTLRHTGVRGIEHLFFHVPRFEPLLDQLPCGKVANGLHEGRMSDIVEGPFDVRIHDPWPGRVGPCQAKKLFNRVVTSPARAKPVANALKPGFPKRFQGVFHHSLDASIDDGGDAQRALALSLGDIDPPDGANLVSVELAELCAQPCSFFRGRDEHLIDTRSILAVVHLRHPANADQHVRPASQHQSLQRPDLLQVVVS
jgi:hypothetical protein